MTTMYLLLLMVTLAAGLLGCVAVMVLQQDAHRRSGLLPAREPGRSPRDAAGRYARRPRRNS
jgi:hypothetical protein